MNKTVLKIRIGLNCAIALLLVGLTADFGGRPLLNVVGTLERQATDWRLTRHADSRKNRDIVIVDIDRDSLQSIGSWPWSRGHIAQILDQLFNKYQVRVATFMFPFVSPDDEGVYIFDEVSKALNADDGDTRLSQLREQFDYDKLLAAAINDRKVVLSYSFDDSARVDGVLPPPVEIFDFEDKERRISGGDWSYYRGYAGNLPPLLEKSSSAGFVNFIADDDGFVRRAQLTAQHAKRVYESLALSLLRNAGGPNQVRLFAQTDSGSVETILVGRYEAPINEAGDMYLNFLGPGGPSADFENAPGAVFRYVSAVNVISGSAPEDVLRDKIVIIGSSSESLRDVYSTPINSEVPGAELLATQLANIMEGRVLHRLASSDTLAFGVLILAALVAAAVFATTGPVLSALLTLVLCGGFIYINLNKWDNDLLVVNFVAPILVMSGLFLWNSISGFVFEWRASRHLQSTFGQYVPPELAKRMGETQTLRMEGESREISVLFSDVRNFTSISEKYSPQDLTRLMNRMLTALSEAIHHEGGTVDKFIGDAVMAFWNAPLDDPNHAANSVASALEMQTAMKALSDDMVREGNPPMRLGVGICTGEASVGNMGSKLRMAYTAMGDTVNVASRIEGLTKYYKVGILVTEATYKQCKDSGIYFRLVDSVRVKGREQALVIYEPIGSAQLLPPEKLKALEMFNAMHADYVRGDFAAALEKLEQCRELDPSDGLCEVYGNRLAEFMREPPAEWDGVINFETK